ncbi:GLYL3 protein, partial [Piaya cayana]|nr:GLYL3 protein [Piaya cayana]
VYGAVMHINRGNPGEMEVAVDTWPDFGAVLARQRGEVAGGDIVCVCGGVPMSWGLPPPTSLHLADPPNLRRLPPTIRLGSLSVAHAELLAETWPYGGNSRSRQYLAETLSRLPNLCLQDEALHPVCWVLTDHFGTGAHGYTLRAHRRHGYMRAALAITARRLHARGFPSFG